MTARDEILTAIRDHRPARLELPHVPATALRPGRPRAPRGPAALAGPGLPGRPPHLLRGPRSCSAVPEVPGTVGPADFPDWAAPADVEVTVVRTPLGVAETGSILLTENELGITTSAVLAQHLVVLLDPADLVENIHQAYQHAAFQEAAYAVLLSGPSGSADIGGSTVHPAQGVTTLTVILVPAPPQVEMSHDPGHAAETA